MKIINLQAENVKRLVAVEIRPDGNLVQITGRNGSGKTSILDSIWWALAGAGNLQAVPIRKGQKTARIRLDLGEIVVTRTFKKTDDGPTTSAITVENAEGARFPSPQHMLDSLLGTLSFDPLAFSRMTPREQFDELKAFVPGVDFDAIEKANQADYAERTATNRRAKEARAAIAGIPVPAEAPSGPVDEAALLDALQKAGELNASRERLLAARDAAKARVAEMRESADRLERQAQQLREQAAELESQPSYEVGEPINVSAAREALDAARRANRLWQDVEKRRSQVSIAEGLEEAAEVLTARMQGRYEEREAAIAAAKMPVPGLGLADGIVTLNGLPFEQASDAEKLKISVSLAMASNPKLRVIRVRDGSLLDADSLKALGEMADAADMQTWIERVDDTGKVGFVIDDGRLAADTTTKESA